jgi:hypothetical protein
MLRIQQAKPNYKLNTEAVSSSETTVKLYQTTRRRITEDSILYCHRCGDLKTNIAPNFFMGAIWLVNYRRTVVD